MRSATTDRATRVVAVLIAATLVAGCRLPSSALDGPLAVPLRIETTADSIEVDAPTWFAQQTVIYLCPTDPPNFPSRVRTARVGRPARRATTTVRSPRLMG